MTLAERAMLEVHKENDRRLREEYLKQARDGADPSSCCKVV